MKTSHVIGYLQCCNANQAHLIPTFHLFKVSVMDASYPSITFVMATVLFQGHIVNTVGCPCVSHARLDQSASRSRLTLSFPDHLPYLVAPGTGGRRPDVFYFMKDITDRSGREGFRWGVNLAKRTPNV